MLHIASTYVLSAMKIDWVVYKNQNRLTSRKFFHKMIFSYVITRYFFIKRICLSLMPIYKVSQGVTGMLNTHLYSILRFDWTTTPIIFFQFFDPEYYDLLYSTIQKWPLARLHLFAKKIYINAYHPWFFLSLIG